MLDVQSGFRKNTVRKIIFKQFSKQHIKYNNKMVKNKKLQQYFNNVKNAFDTMKGEAIQNSLYW